jgi:hypothetical protein
MNDKKCPDCGKLGCKTDHSSQMKKKVINKVAAKFIKK